ncbi:MAG TPA: capsule biosynthesis protein, partial [Cupriavidus sp.]|nr:capsule biosynthesis protein [Cupriavidus sp.]
KHYVIHQSQVNASFYTGGKTVPNQGMRGIRCAARALVEMTGRLLRASIHGIQRFGAIASRLVTGAEPLPQNPLPRKPFSDYDS